MKTTGIIRRIDDLGRIVIPKEVRQLCGINDNDPFEIYVGKEGAIELHKYNPNADEDNPNPIPSAGKIVHIYTNNETGETINEDQANAIIAQYAAEEQRDSDTQADFFAGLIEAGNDSDILWMIYYTDEAEAKAARKRYMENFHEYCLDIANERFDDEYSPHTVTIPF